MGEDVRDRGARGLPTPTNPGTPNWTPTDELLDTVRRAATADCVSSVEGWSEWYQKAMSTELAHMGGKQSNLADVEDWVMQARGKMCKGWDREF